MCVYFDEEKEKSSVTELLCRMADCVNEVRQIGQRIDDVVGPGLIKAEVAVSSCDRHHAGVFPGFKTVGGIFDNHAFMTGKSHSVHGRQIDLGIGLALSEIVTGDDRPVVLSYTFIAYDLLPSFDIRCLQSSFNAYLSEVGIRRSSGYTKFSAKRPTDEQAEIIGTHDAALLRQKIFWRYLNRPFEITFHYYLDERMEVVINRDHDDYGSDTYRKTITKS